MHPRNEEQREKCGSQISRLFLPFVFLSGHRFFVVKGFSVYTKPGTHSHRKNDKDGTGRVGKWRLTEVDNR